MTDRHDCESSSPRTDDTEECAKVLIGEWHRVSLEMVCASSVSLDARSHVAQSPR